MTRASLRAKSYENQNPSSVLLACLTAIPCWAQTLPAFVNGQVPNLVETYEGIHEPTLRTGVTAMASVAMDLLRK